MKKDLCIHDNGRERLKKILLIMKLKCLFLFICCMQLSGNVHSQKEEVNILVKNGNIREVLAAIKQQSSYTFVYNVEELEQWDQVSIELKNATVEEVLNLLFHGKNFSYSVVDQVIIIKKDARQQQSQQQQTILLQGVVLDEEDQPLPGVTVVIEGTTFGVSTNAKGEFSITLPNNTANLVFSFVGMENQVIKIDPLPQGERHKAITVVMKEKQVALEDIVVTGIYTREKESHTGSSVTYTAKELKVIGNQNILQSLKTLDPSFAILENNQFGSDPNRLPDIEIRGKTSVIGLSQEYDTDPNQPLFILDGFESTLKIISDLSMDRVESITILKDASATAIYGSKAANGVVVVETLAPKTGKLRLNYSTNLNFSFADLSDYNLMNSTEKLEFEKLSGHHGKVDQQGNLMEEGGQQRHNTLLAEIKRGVNSYWMDDPLRFATSHSHNLYIDGGDRKMRYGLGFSYNNVMGVMKGSGRNVLNGNVRLMYRHNQFSFSNYLNIDHMLAEREKVNFSQFSRANPYYRKWNQYGVPEKIVHSYYDNDPNSSSFGRTSYVYNPLYDMSLNSRNEDRSFGFRNNFEIEWRPVEVLRARGRFSISKSVTRNESFQSPFSTAYVNIPENERGSYRESQGETSSYDADFSVTFGQLFNEVHLVNAVGGVRLSEQNNKTSSFEARGFIDEQHGNPNFSNGYPSGGRPTYRQSTKRSVSFYLNTGYSYKSRYLFDANLRSDGSSVFGISNRFTSTWAVGLAWNVHNEAFFEDIPGITLLKLRFSVGNPGNQNFDAYMTSNIYKYSNSYPNFFGLSALISAWGNRNLEWQKTKDQNYGVDVELWKRRIRFSFDYFSKDTDPLLIHVQLPSSVGTTSNPMNVGKQVTRGYTAMLTGVIIKKQELNWQVNMNARHLKAEYRNIGNSLDQFNKENRSSNLVRYYDGGSPYDMWAVRSAGIDPVSGREIFIKKDGSQTFIFDYTDEVVVGNSTPKIEGVIGSSFYYKGFSASINMRYRLGGQIFMRTLFEKVENISTRAIQYNQDKRALYDRWKKPGDIAKFKAISMQESTRMSSRFVMDENTLSGESISLGYETQAPWLKHIGASSLSLRGYMNDIFRLSSVKDERGLDYPFARNVSFSMRLLF